MNSNPGSLQDKEKSFSRLVKRMENDEANSIAGEDSTIRRAWLDAARCVPQELREDLKEWETKACRQMELFHRPTRGVAGQTIAQHGEFA